MNIHSKGDLDCGAAREERRERRVLAEMENAQERPIMPQLHFVLVHGCWHGAWCWYKTVDLLQKSGHRVTAVDLASAGMHAADPDSIGSFEEYIQPLLDVLQATTLDSSNQRVILVGHSFGGLSIGHAMEAFPQKIAVAIFVAAFMVPYRSSFSQIYKQTLEANPALEQVNYFFGKGPDHPATSLKPRNSLLLTNFYQKSPSQDCVLGQMLVKRSPVLPDLSYMVKYTRQKYGSVCRVYIRAEKDLTIPPEIQGLMIAQNPPDHVYSLDSDHSPFFSLPAELNRLLLHIGATHFSH